MSVCLIIAALLSPVDLWSHYPYYSGGVSMGAMPCPTHHPGRDRPSIEDIEDERTEIEDMLENVKDNIRK